MKEQQLDMFAAARVRRDTGMQRAVDHADAQEPGWSELAYRFLVRYATESDQPFLAENVIAAARAAGLPEPPDGRAYGAVIQRAHREGVTVKAGFAAAATSNCSPKVLWRRA